MATNLSVSEYCMHYGVFAPRQQLHVDWPASVVGAEPSTSAVGGLVGRDGAGIVSANGFITLGDELPELELPGLDGTPHALSEYIGQKLLVFMWASW